jgi:hypothetical protein
MPKLNQKEICDIWLKNKNINPETLRKIKENGPLFKKIQKRCSLNRKSDKEICDKWFKNKMINPETLRKIKENGPLYRELQKRCLDNNDNDNDKAATKIQKLFKPFIKRVSANIIDRINFFLIIRKYILLINKKYKNICMRLYKYDPKTNLPIYRLGNKIILDKQIGSKSTYGIAYLAHYENDINNQSKLNALNKFAVKVINYSHNNEIEYKVLTEVSKQVILFKCPHFPITYGFLSCDNKNIKSNYNIDLKINKSDINNSKNYPDLINNNISLYYQINELASGDLNKFRVYNSKNSKLLSNSLAQIYLSIMFFHKYINAFHNDAHGGNFLYHLIKPGGYFHYNIYGKDYYLENIGYLWVIWDFGLIQPFQNSKTITKNKFGKYKKKLIITIDYVKSIFKYLDYPNLFNSDFINIINKIYLILNKYSNINNFLLLSELNKELLKLMIVNISTFTTIKPDNIINKKPYII